MFNKALKTPLILAASAVLTIGLSATSVVNAADNPFGMTALSSGYMVASAEKEGKCGEGKCGADKAKEAGDKAKEGKCGEGKCGADKAKEAGDKAKEGKCGEGKCGGS